MPPDTGSSSGGGKKTSFAQSLVVLLKTRTQGGIYCLQRDELGLAERAKAGLGEPVISAGGRERREDWEVKANLDCTMRGAKEKKIVKS